MNKNNKFTLTQLCFMALTAVLGVFAKPIFAPVINLVTDFIRIPGGSVSAGISMLFLVFGAALINKSGTATMMAFTQAVITLSTGFSSVAGLLSLITYTVPGIAIDVVLCSSLFKSIKLKQRMGIAGSCGVLAGAVFTNSLYYRLSFIAFLLFYILGIFSGYLAGLLAHVILQRIPERMKKGIIV